jgi:hypothetical protein
VNEVVLKPASKLIGPSQVNAVLGNAAGTGTDEPTIIDTIAVPLSIQAPKVSVTV